MGVAVRHLNRMAAAFSKDPSRTREAVAAKTVATWQDDHEARRKIQRVSAVDGQEVQAMQPDADAVLAEA